MSSLKESLYAALLEYVKKNYDSTAVEVTDFEDRTEWGGYCETCEYQYTVVDISYRDDQGRNRLYTFDAAFAQLITDLS